MSNTEHPKDSRSLAVEAAKMLISSQVGRVFGFLALCFTTVLVRIVGLNAIVALGISIFATFAAMVAWIALKKNDKTF